MRRAIPFLFVVAAFPAFALGTSEVSGVVEDVDGQPVKGAVVTFTNTTTSSAVYEVKTDKKGRYFIPSLLYYTPGLWNVTVEAEGYVPRKIKVESRKSDKTRVGAYETGIKAGQPHEVKIAAFGKATVDFVVATEEQASQAAERTATAAAASGGQPAQAVPEAGPDPFDTARRRVADGDLAGSIEWFRKAVEAEPADAERRELLAKVLYNTQRYDEAEAEAKKLEETDPDRPGLHLLLADIYTRLERYDEAGTHLGEAASRSPEDPHVFKRMAWIAEKTGRLEDAISANEKIAALEADNVESWLALGDLYARAGQMDRSEAAYTKVVELDPSNAYKTFFNIGVLLENKASPTPNEERRALEAFRRAVESKPDWPQAHRHLAYALLRNGDLPGARKEFERFLALDPEAADAPEIRSLISGLPD